MIFRILLASVVTLVLFLGVIVFVVLNKVKNRYSKEKQIKIKDNFLFLIQLSIFICTSITLPFIWIKNNFLLSIIAISIYGFLFLFYFIKNIIVFKKIPKDYYKGDYNSYQNFNRNKKEVLIATLSYICIGIVLFRNIFIDNTFDSQYSYWLNLCLFVLSLASFFIIMGILLINARTSNLSKTIIGIFSFLIIIALCVVISVYITNLIPNLTWSIKVTYVAINIAITIIILAIIKSALKNDFHDLVPIIWVVIIALVIAICIIVIIALIKNYPLPGILGLIGKIFKVCWKIIKILGAVILACCGIAIIVVIIMLIKDCFD